MAALLVLALATPAGAATITGTLTGPTTINEGSGGAWRYTITGYSGTTADHVHNSSFLFDFGDGSSSTTHRFTPALRPGPTSIGTRAPSS